MWEIACSWQKDIQKLEQFTDDNNKEDYLLFIGSSSIRRWVSIEEEMYPYSSVRRGYGGAHYYDLIHYVERLVKNKEKAKAIILFVANDIRGSSSEHKLHKDLTPHEIKKLFKAVTKKIHKKLSDDMPIYVIETTPTPSRWKVWDQIATANDLIQSYTETKSNIHFIPTRDAFLNKRCPYIMRLHASPELDDGHFHFHVEFYPPLRSGDKRKVLAGSETMAGVFIMDVLPEESAKILRAYINK